MVENLEKTLSAGCKQTTLFLLLVFMNLWECLTQILAFLSDEGKIALETIWAKMMSDVNTSKKFIFLRNPQTIFNASTLESGINIPPHSLIFVIFSRGCDLIMDLKNLNFDT